MTILRVGSLPPTPPGRYPVYARSGWEIPQADPIELQQLMERQTLELVRIRTESLLVERRKRDHSPIQMRSASPYPYNCVGMIFASRRAYIEIDHIYDLLAHDGYRRIDRAEVTVGDVVLYKITDEPEHVALIVEVARIGGSISIRVLSKWGLDGEIEHLMENVPPALGQPVEFYTERQL